MNIEIRKKHIHEYGQTETLSQKYNCTKLTIMITNYCTKVIHYFLIHDNMRYKEKRRNKFSLIERLDN
jgi:hypothetical protein